MNKNRLWLTVITLIVLIGITVWMEVRAEPAPPWKANQYKWAIAGEGKRVFGLQAPISSFAAQIHQESAWREDAKSWAGAMGLSQFMPGTAAWLVKLYPQLWPASPYSARWAIRAMIRYDRHLWDVISNQHKTKPADDCNHMAFVLASYNGGARWTAKRRAKAERPDLCFGDTGACKINPGIKPSNQKENQGYSYRILKQIEPRYLVHNWGRAVCWRLK